MHYLKWNTLYISDFGNKTAMLDVFTFFYKQNLCTRVEFVSLCGKIKQFEFHNSCFFYAKN